MPSPPAVPEILVVAPRPDEQRLLASALGSLVRPRTLVPSDLTRSAALLDAVAAVAWIDRASPGSLEGMLPICDLPAGRALVLVTRDLSDGLLEDAIRRLNPVAVLKAPVQAPALRLAVHRALPGEDLGRGARENQRPAPIVLGVSAAIRDVLEQVRKIAPSGLPVLILGETGTGKELVARSIHLESPRAERPFVTVNCGALPETLLESELFGYRRGAFTGAADSKRGLFQEADRGTLFLDEIGDTSPAFQVKLLRAIEAQEVRPLGTTESVHFDVRIVSATHQDLEAAVERGTFRRDLLYRLNSVAIELPPLRRRRVDIPFLAQHFAEEFGEAHARRVTLGEDFLDSLARHEFPGNIRELRNAVERAIALTGPGETVCARRLDGLGQLHSHATIPTEGSLRERIELVETAAIQDALERFQGNRTRVAEALGVSRLGLRQKMRRLGLDRAR